MKNIFLPKELNRDDSMPICIDKQYGPSSTDMHWHSCAEIIHLQQGSALLFCREKWEKLEAPDTIFLPPGHLHCCHCTDPDAVKIVMGLDERCLPDFGVGNEHALTPLRPVSFDGTLIFRQSEKLAVCFKHLGCIEEIQSLTDELTLLLDIQHLYCTFLSVWEKEGTIRRLPKQNPIVTAIEQLIEDEFTQPLTAADAAERLNISYSHMANLLRWELGSSFGDLLLKKRVDAAKRLLLTTNLSITEIGLNTGFTDASYFIRKFSSLVGTTPYKYRTENLKHLH